MLSEDPAESEVPLAMITVSDAEPTIQGSEQSLRDDYCREVVRKRRRMGVAPIHLADLIDPADVDLIRDHGVQLKELMQVSNLPKEVVRPQKLISGVGGQPQRSTKA